MTKTTRTTKPRREAAAQAAPSFYLEQLTAALDAPPDLVQALLESGRLYTIDEAQKIINNYLTRKV